jgi:hypothetical protein
MKSISFGSFDKVKSVTQPILQKYRTALFVGLFLLVGWLLISPNIARGQDDAPLKLELTGIDTSALPILSIRLTGAYADGRAIDYNQTPLEIQHGAELISQEQFTSIESEEIGTLTLVLVDTPGGVANELAAIQEAILMYANNDSESTFMHEPVDSIGIYAVDFSDPKALLEPTFFRNGVVNWLAEELPVQSGPTALYDSLDILLGQVSGLKPRPEMVASIIVFTDGTDSVSTRTDQAEVMQKAVDLNIAIHTVHLNNVAIFSAEEGQQFLQTASARTGGVATELNTEGIQHLWEAVSSFSKQTVIRYRPTDPVPGNVPISIRLKDYPQIEAFTSAQFPADQLQVEIQTGESVANIVMPDTSQLLDLSIPVGVTWLDGRERSISTVQVLKDGELAAEIPVGESSFTSAEMTLSGLQYGPNEIVLAVMDENGNRGNSAPFILNIAPGDSLIVPDNISTTSSGFGWTWLIGLIGLLVLLAIVAYWVLFSTAGGKKIKIVDLFKSAFSNEPRRRSKQPSDFAENEADTYEPISPSSSSSLPAGADTRRAQESGVAQSLFCLDVIDATETAPETVPILGLEQRIGRSSSKADISFEKEQSVSRVHATLAREANSYRLYDEQSTAGTFVNGVRLPEYGMMLSDGDEIQMGALVLRFRRAD